MQSKRLEYEDAMQFTRMIQPEIDPSLLKKAFYEPGVRIIIAKGSWVSYNPLSQTFQFSLT